MKRIVTLFILCIQLSQAMGHNESVTIRINQSDSVVEHIKTSNKKAKSFLQKLSTQPSLFEEVKASSFGQFLDRSSVLFLKNNAITMNHDYIYAHMGSQHERITTQEFKDRMKYETFCTIDIDCLKENTNAILLLLKR